MPPESWQQSGDCKIASINRQSKWVRGPYNKLELVALKAKINSFAKEEKDADKLRLGQKEEKVFTEEGRYRQG